MLVPIKDLKTVGDLVARIAKQTQIELYCDPVYEKKVLTWAANGKSSAAASELMRALAFCVTGTYRRVGTAFVLTDDLMGLGTRRQMVRDFEEECASERRQAVQDAEKKIKANPAQKNLKLNAFDDPLAMTPEQEKAQIDPAKIIDQASDMMDTINSLGGASLPYNKLTPRQQEAVQAYEKAVSERKTNAGEEAPAADSQPDFDKNIHLLKKLSIQMVITGLDGVAATNLGVDLTPLFRPEFTMPEISANVLKQYQNSPKWTEAAKKYTRRAAICKPHTTADVDASLVRIRALGFNQMWLTVFESGKARIPGTGFPLDPACDPKMDILTYAIAEGKKQGITVCPVVNVFAWGTDAPQDLRLLTLRGENSAQNALRRSKIADAPPVSPYLSYMSKIKKTAPSPAIWVDPTQPTTQASLSGLFQAIASHSGAGDFICRDLSPMGFNGPNQNFESPFFRRDYDGMGYNEALRLAFLRINHCDPVDITNIPGNGNQYRANVAIANSTGEDDEETWRKWMQFRVDALQMALHSLINPLLKISGDKKPGVLIEQASVGDFMTWLDIVSDPKASFLNANPFGIEPPAFNDSSKPLGPALVASMMFLPKQAPYEMPKPLVEEDWRGLEMQSLELTAGGHKWDGIAIEE